MQENKNISQNKQNSNQQMDKSIEEYLKFMGMTDIGFKD